MVHREIEAVLGKQSHTGGVSEALAVEDKREEQIERELPEEHTDGGKENLTELGAAETFTQLEAHLAALTSARPASRVNVT